MSALPQDSPFLIALSSFEQESNALFIKWKYIDKKGYNIIYFLETLLGENPFSLGIEITRKESLAKSESGEVLSFFEVMV